MNTRHFQHWFHPAASLQLPTLDLASIHDPVIRDTAEAFQNNIEQIAEAAVAPLLLLVYSSASQSVTDRACLQVFGDLESRPLTDPRVGEFETATKEHWAIWNASNSSTDAMGKRMFMAAGDLDLLMDVQPTVRRGFEATLKGIVIGAWTAFEVLTSDLWEAAVNAYPRQLAALRGYTSGLRRPKSTSGAFQEAEGESNISRKHVRLDFLQANDFDLSAKMGTVLRERFNFQILSGIQEAYLSAFSQSTSRVRTIIVDGAIDALACTRNVLVHRSGIVDAQFMHQHRRLPVLQALFPEASVGGRLDLSGLSTHQLIQPVLSNAIELLVAVNSLGDPHVSGGSVG